MKEIGEKIKACRLASRMTLKQLSAKAGGPMPTFPKWRGAGPILD